MSCPLGVKVINPVVSSYIKPSDLYQITISLIYSCFVSSLTCHHTELLQREDTLCLSEQFHKGEDWCQLCTRTSILNQEEEK